MTNVALQMKCTRVLDQGGKRQVVLTLPETDLFETGQFALTVKPGAKGELAPFADGQSYPVSIDTDAIQ